MKDWRAVLTICAVASGMLAVAACDSGEQNRPLNYKKGVYLGKPHTALSQETLDNLKRRANYQAGLSTVSSGGVSEIDEPSGGSDVRPPASATVNAGAPPNPTSGQRNK